MLKPLSELVECQNFVWNFWTSGRVYVAGSMPHAFMQEDFPVFTQNVHGKYFWPILITFICDVKIDVNIFEPHYVNLFFVSTSSIVYVFDFLTFAPWTPKR